MKIRKQWNNALILVVGLLAAWAHPALAGVTNYVTPTGAGLVDGSSWDNAFSNVQDAVTACAGNGDIRLREGTYVLTNEVVISGAASLMIKGGYAGVGETLSDEETVITRDESVFTRLYNVTNSTVTFDSLTMTGGTRAEAPFSGMGLYVSASDVTMTNCVVANSYRSQVTTHRGAGLYMAGGSLTVIDSSFTNNIAIAWADRGYVYGGGIYADGVTVNISGTLFEGNVCNARYLANQGGALYLTGGSASIRECDFIDNKTLKNEDYSRDNGRGGAIFAKSLSSLDISDSRFTGNYNNEKNGRGGSIYLEGAGQKTILSRCVFYKNGTRPSGAAVTDSGSIYLLNGSLFMTNVLHAANLYGNSLDIAGGTVEAVNCTFAANANGYGISQTAGSFSLRNCIIWGNTSGAYNFTGGTAETFDYSCVQDAQTGIGNSTADPLFADDVYYHVKSAAGNYSDGWFKDGMWEISDATSPTIDAGDPSLAWANEPQPNFHLVNIGYDANTPVASKSVLGDNPVVSENEINVFAYAAQDITASSALAVGEVASTGGGDNPIVTLVWGDSEQRCAVR